jgi:hypothetical protein
MPSTPNQPKSSASLKGNRDISRAELIAQQELRTVFGENQLWVSSTAQHYRTNEPTTDLPFEQALVHLKAGERLTRAAWDNPEIYLQIQRPDTQSKMTLPYLYMTRHGERFPVDPSGESILATDWMVVES